MNARSMCEEMAESDFIASRKIRDVFGQFIVDAQFPLLLQLQNRRRRELLANRPDAKGGLLDDGLMMFPVGQAVALFKKNFAMLRHQDRQAGVVGFNQSTQQRV